MPRPSAYGGPPGTRLLSDTEQLKVTLGTAKRVEPAAPAPPANAVLRAER
jgi:hypothetical protein